jgi:hypothetical protein
MPVLLLDNAAMCVQQPLSIRGCHHTALLIITMRWPLLWAGAPKKRPYYGSGGASYSDQNENLHLVLLMVYGSKGSYALGGMTLGASSLSTGQAVIPTAAHPMLSIPSCMSSTVSYVRSSAI